MQQEPPGAEAVPSLAADEPTPSPHEAPVVETVFSGCISLPFPIAWFHLYRWWFFYLAKKTGWVFIYRQCCIPNANQHAYLAPIPKAAARMMSEIHIPEADGIVTVVLPVVDDTTPPL